MSDDPLESIVVTLRAVVFDIGGVLEHTPRTGWQRRWARRLGLSESAFAQRLSPFWSLGDIGALDLSEVERRTAQALALDDRALRELMDDMWHEYLGALNAELAAYFASLRPRYRTGILSNSFVGAREREQAAYGFAEMCDAVVYSHEEGSRKPQPAFYRVVCERLGVTPEQALLLDDLPMCVDGARAVGMTAIRFQDTAQAIAELNDRLDADARGRS